MTRAALLACCVIVTAAYAQRAPPVAIEQLAAQSQRQRENTLAEIRFSDGGDEVLLALETEAAIRADARREEGRPPLFPGCLRADEFELAAQLALARASLDAKAYRVLAVEYRRLTTALRLALADSQASGRWRPRFAHVGHWIDDWEHAGVDVTRELLRRTLLDQAIRASLSQFAGARIYGKSRAAVALRVYDEYVFNLMCTADEDNLSWLKQQLETIGWFDIGKYGWAADQAASLMVQHADGDPQYQAYIAAALEPRVASGDTNPQNFAVLSDRVAVRAGRPQRYATQVECVNGEWLAPKIEEPESLDARRARVGLPPYLEQLADTRLVCGRRHR